VARIDAMQTEYDGLSAEPQDDVSAFQARAQRRETINLEMTIVVEAFYYFAWRFCKILKAAKVSGHSDPSVSAKFEIFLSSIHGRRAVISYLVKALVLVPL
jgi:hypothetical protein